MKLKGVNLRKTNTFFDEFDYEPEIVTDTIFQQDRAENQAVFQEKITNNNDCFPWNIQSKQVSIIWRFCKKYIMKR